MKTIFFLFLILLSSCSVYALDFDASIGKTERTHEASYSIGASTKLFDQRVRFGYANLGTPNPNMNVLPSDYADDDMAGWGGAPCHWLSMKEIKELYLTVDPVLYRGVYDIGLELGAAAYHPQWQQDICVNAVKESAHRINNPVNISPIFGVFVSSQKYEVVLSYQNITQRGDWENQTPKSGMFNLSWRIKF